MTQGRRPLGVSRQALCRTILDGCAARRSYAIIGGPSTGKTSCLEQVDLRLRERWEGSVSPGRKIVGLTINWPVDIQPGSPLLAPLLWETMTDILRHPLLRVGSLDVPRPVFGNPRRDPWESLSGACDELWRQLRGTAAWFEWVLMVDEGSQSLGANQWLALGDLCRLVRTERAWAPISLVVAGGRGLRDFVSQESKAAGWGLRPLLLGALEDADATRLIRRYVANLSPDEMRTIKRMTGRHPFLLTRVLESGCEQGTLGDVAALRVLAQHEVSILYPQILHVLMRERRFGRSSYWDGPIHALIELLIRAGFEGCGYKYAEGQVAMGALRDTVELLEYVGIVERYTEASSLALRLLGDLWPDWYEAQRALS